jgi:hypothetical protein
MAHRRLEGYSAGGPIDALQPLGHLVCPSHIPDRNPVAVGLLMSELHLFSDYDNDNDNDNDNVFVPCATYC